MTCRPSRRARITACLSFGQRGIGTIVDRRQEESALTWSPRGDSNPRPADYEPAPLCVCWWSVVLFGTSLYGCGPLFVPACDGSGRRVPGRTDTPRTHVGETEAWSWLKGLRQAVVQG